MGNDITRLDANESVFFARQLEHINAKTYDTKYKNLKAKQFIPVSTEVPAGADTYTWRSYSKVGMAKMISDYATDFPDVDLYGEEHTAKVYGQGVSYKYSIKEIRRAQMTGMPLTAKKAENARRAIEEKHDKLAWLGDADYNLQGFLNYPGITSVTRTTGAAGDTWALKTPDEIIADLTALCDGVSVPTLGREEVNQIIMPRALYNLIKNTRMTDGNDKNILQYFMSNNPGIMVDIVDELVDAGAGSTTRIMGYVKDTDHLTQEIPQMFEQFPADKEGMVYKIPCYAEFGGVNVYYPLSVAYMDNL